MGLRQNLLKVVLGDLPTPDSKLEEGNPRYDEVLGGKKSPGVWGRFSMGWGTTCIVTLDGWAIDAGFPDDMVIKTDTPNGGGTPVLRAMYAGSDKRGWTRTPKRGELPDLRPGYVYVSNHTTKDGSDGTHVGVVLATRVAADGQSMEVDTADGGQGTRDHQYAGRSTRTFKLSSGAHPILIETPGVGESWLERWIVVGGDEADDVALVPSAPAVAGGGVEVLLGLAGVALIAGGAWWYLSRSGGAVNVMHQDVTINLKPRGDDRDFDYRTKYERLLEKSGFELTGMGTSMDFDGHVIGSDVDVRCRRACDQDRLREIAERAGVVVDDIRAWRI